MILKYYSDSGNEYYYEISNEQALEALRYIVSNDIDLSEKDSDKVVDFIYWELRVSDELETHYKEQITDYFRSDGEDYVRDCEEKSRDELGWVGMKESDFI